MDKKELVQIFLNLIQQELDTAKKAANIAHEAAIHSESKAEDPYDTRGLEASYLAGAQSKRVAELEETLIVYRNLDLRPLPSNSAIVSGALVELISAEGKPFYYLMMPKGGGLHATYDGKTVTIVTPQSPLGSAMLGRKPGDTVDVKLQNVQREYEIVKVS